MDDEPQNLDWLQGHWVYVQGNYKGHFIIQLSTTIRTFLHLRLRLKRNKIINDKAKVSIHPEKTNPFGGIFHKRELFSRDVVPVIGKVVVQNVGSVENVRRLQ